ncbi:ABC transporter permease [Paenibacillus sp. PAMC21692]|uniref:ABC transporter permease n=1 Tax=Paenibacillus sp. PAMC21692 TaxID=2762320 RepID=UPI00164DB549|nr:ABC transporter permease [Paenibacillus sp. PAMC21692]QNK57728.1 ABC transporter permease [Paenibacillus sp. PAMC21692]
MKDMIWLLRRTIRSMLRGYKSLLVFLITPVIGIVLAFLIIGGSANPSPLNVGVVNLDAGEPVSDGILAYLEDIEPMEIVTLPSIGEAEEVVLSGELDVAIAIPEGYAQALIEGSADAKAELMALEGSEVASYVELMLNRYVENVSALAAATSGDVAAFEERYAQLDAVAEFGLRKETSEDLSAGRNMTNRSIGYLVIVMMFSAVSLSTHMIKERENRTYYRLLAAPSSSRAYVASNVAANVLLLMLQVAIVLTVMTAGFGIRPGAPVWSIALALVLFAWVAVGLSLVIVAFSRNAINANALQNLLIIPTCLIAGCMFPVEAMPTPLRAIAEFLPQRWLLEGIDGLQSGAPAATLVLNGLTLAAFALTFCLVAAYKFGRNRDTRTFI